MPPAADTSAPILSVRGATLQYRTQQSVVTAAYRVSFDVLRSDRFVVLGQVVGIHIDDRFIKNGRLDTAALQPLARCGYADYAVVDEVFAIARPTTAGRTAAE